MSRYGLKDSSGKYNLVGIDGNAYAVMGYVIKCMREVGLSNDEQGEFTARCMSSDYNNLLCESIDMIDKCNELLVGSEV